MVDSFGKFRGGPSKFLDRGMILMGILNRIANHGLWALLRLGLMGLVVLTGFYCYLSWQLPDVDTLNDVHLQVPLQVFTADGKLIEEFGTKRRIPVTLDEVPQQMINAVLATEDSRYYKHGGVDFVGLVRATTAVVLSGRKVQGASTITMQVARNFFLTRKKTYMRKITEILLALKIDQTFSKDKILELYLNTIYLGQRAYGVAAAAEVYYGKPLSQLTLPEMAMIAGLPKAPSTANPITNPVAAKERRNHVLSRMYELGFINNATYQVAIKAPVNASYHQEKTAVDAPYLAEMVRATLYKEYGDAAYEDGYKVYTTANAKLQQAADAALEDGLIKFDRRHGYRRAHQSLNRLDRSEWKKALNAIPKFHDNYPAAVTSVSAQSLQVILSDGKTISIAASGYAWTRQQNAAQVAGIGDVIYIHKVQGQWQLQQIPNVEGAIISINPQDGAILALSGGYSYAQSHFNRAIQAERQPGSNFKPFIYSAALAKDGYTLATLINDAPIVVKQSGGQWWRPHNDTNEFYGPTRMRIGLIKSRNLVSIRLLQSIEIPYALDYIKNFGFNIKKQPDTLSLALGTGVVTPLELVTGYAVFANGGYRVTPFFIQKIIDGHNKVIYDANPELACAACITDSGLPADLKPNPMAPLAITPQNAYLMNQALHDVIQNGTGSAAKVLNRSDLGGKTGTTNDQKDAWFSGFNGGVVTTVWVGFDNLKPLHEYAAQAALPIWMQFMSEALAGKPEQTMPEPSDIVRVRIDAKTGLLAKTNDPNAIFEIFRKGTEPTETSPDTESKSSDKVEEIDMGQSAVEHLF